MNSNDIRSTDKPTHEPSFMGYQLLGDSQLLRFSEWLLKIPRKMLNGGLCVSGQKIQDLLGLVLEGNHPIEEKVILMIGTNDILKDLPTEKMCEQLETLVLKVIENGAYEVIILTVPPIPRLIFHNRLWNSLKKYNEHIKSLHNGEDILVIDAYSKFVKMSCRSDKLTSIKRYFKKKSCSFLTKISLPPILEYLESVHEQTDDCIALSDETCDTHLPSDKTFENIEMRFFEKYINETSKKIDLIHLNASGLKEIKRLLIARDYINTD